MYAKEAPSLLDRYTLAKSFGFKGVECAFPYEFSKEDLIKVTILRLWSFMLLT
jgi:hydroxypyruvate isomerase